VRITSAPFSSWEWGSFDHPIKFCHLERNKVIGKAEDLVESKDPYPINSPTLGRHFSGRLNFSLSDAVRSRRASFSI